MSYLRLLQLCCYKQHYLALLSFYFLLYQLQYITTVFLLQTLYSLEYPALRLADPVSVQEFSAAAQSLKQSVDKARKTQSGNVEEFDIDEDF